MNTVVCERCIGMQTRSIKNLGNIKYNRKQASHFGRVVEVPHVHFHQIQHQQEVEPRDQHKEQDYKTVSSQLQKQINAKKMK